jgi:hypothetical protein
MSDQSKTIGSGFQIELPAVFLSWGTPLVNAREALSAQIVSFRSGGLSATCTVLNGLECRILLYGSQGFEPSSMHERLTMIRFWRQGEFRATFDDIQRHLEMTFGPPHETIPGSDDWPAEYKWVIGDVVVGHYADDKGTGPQELASIRKAF